MMMPGRMYSAQTGYRYGFNGKENDNEVKGEGNEVDYGMRVYDPRIGRFLSVDPLFEQFPWYTPYQFAGNSPIANVDIDGQEEEYYKLKVDEKTGKPQLTLTKKIEEKSILWGLISWKPELERFVEYKGQTYIFGNDAEDNQPKLFSSFVPDPESTLQNNLMWSKEQSDEDFWIQAGTVVALGTVNAYTSLGKNSVTTPKAQQKSVTEQEVQTQEAKPASQQKAATNVQRPTPRQSENELTPDNVDQQVAFKNGKPVATNKKGSVRPDGYDVNSKISYEIKNYDVRTDKGINSLVNNVVKQVRQRLSNLPMGSKQNVIIDVRGQDVNQATLNTIRNRISQNVNIQFKTND
jgi:RHS repeat-associated protein